MMGIKECAKNTQQSLHYMNNVVTCVYVQSFAKLRVQFWIAKCMYFYPTLTKTPQVLSFRALIITTMFIIHYIIMV